MDHAAPANELERRKQLKIRLRGDLAIDAQKYEGRTYFVVKDPVSLRYYRLKEHEHYLLQYMDGERTLEEAQKAYEKHYRPDRLTLEDLEAFAQQLINAGLAQNDSPKAGKQLFDRRKKRRRSEWMQALTNILYIKIPIYDPDRLLIAMLRYCSWIFTTWFFALSIAVMGAAILLVATHFDTFRSKLPNYHEFFSFKTVIYLWIALGCVKVIHEFGHGLSCRVFGGEVHEMGALFLCFSPALYCNVSDAWTLPNKWHRIIISAAGIYVELIIAAIATFVWWNTPTQPFINNLSLSLMVVCSVSTIVFNANPLMRYDGYYVLADWLEIPNLRERSNRFLTNLVLEHCLGIEVVPEPYMALWRRILFVVYAITSYVYRWVVTFAILYFMHSFLQPYKLGVVSDMLALAAIASMVGWPAYRLGKNIHRRGRLPDMKRTRVAMTGAVLAAVALFVCFVPLPLSRVRAPGLVQAHPDATENVYLRRPGILEELRVRDGQTVNRGDLLAIFSDPKLEPKLLSLRTEAETNQNQIELLNKQKQKETDPGERTKLDQEIARATTLMANALTEMSVLEKIRNQDLKLYAPRSGVVANAPRVEDVGKHFDPQSDPSKPFLTINDNGPTRLRVCVPVVTPEFHLLKEQLERNQAAAEAASEGYENHAELDVTIRVQGRGPEIWKGRLTSLPESEAKDIPLALSSKSGGPVPVKAYARPGALAPQTQHYLIFVDLLNPDAALVPGQMAQVKIHCKPETCLHWLWRKVNDTFDLGLL
jgi:putative peptide zinc metalloprotease protein